MTDGDATGGALPVAAIVVTFWPDADVEARLRSYVGVFGAVIVVDNTDGDRPEAASDPAGLHRLRFGTNRGIGSALNAGVALATAEGFRTVLLLDQDSVVERPAVELALAAMAPGVALVALRPVLRGLASVESSRAQAESCHDVSVAITSGSLLDVAAYRACGDFDARLFIDYVDYDYCLRLRRAGYRIVECPGATIDHALGEPKEIRRAGRTHRFASHRPFRSYYITRNGLYVATTHFRVSPSVALGVVRTLIKELIKTMFVEDERRVRLGFMARGVRDFAAHRFGELPTP